MQNNDNQGSPTRSGVNFNLDFGTKPTTEHLEEVVVKLDPTIMLGDFASAYHQELMRRNPIKLETSGITPEDLEEYFEGLLSIRISSVVGKSKFWRQAKQLFIPTWIEFVISRIGQFIDFDNGLKFIPSYDKEIDIDKMLSLSIKLGSFISDGVSMHKDAFPRDIDGDKDVMSMAIIDDYVKSMSVTSHPISSYVSAFLGAKLEEETAFKILYRVRYDDINFIRSMILAEDSLI